METWRRGAGGFAREWRGERREAVGEERDGGAEPAACDEPATRAGRD